MKKLYTLLVFGFVLFAYGCGDDGDKKRDLPDNYVEAVEVCADGNKDVSAKMIKDFKADELASAYSSVYPLCADVNNKYEKCIIGAGCEMLLEVALDLHTLGDEDMDALKKKTGGDKCDAKAVENCVIDKYYKDEYAYQDYYKSCVDEYNKSHSDAQMDNSDPFTKLVLKTTKCLDESHLFFKCAAKLSCDDLISMNKSGTIDDFLGDGGGLDEYLGDCKDSWTGLKTCVVNNMKTP
ncbi:MAG: hypothetical protein J6A01_05900 [Proteobacteria bacterium]|nr:hypothetical protein [Pseudomonadota bacterium]